MGFNLFLGIVIEVKGLNWNCVKLGIGRRGKFIYELGLVRLFFSLGDGIEVSYLILDYGC